MEWRRVQAVQMGGGGTKTARDGLEKVLHGRVRQLLIHERVNVDGLPRVAGAVNWIEE